MRNAKLGNHLKKIQDWILKSERIWKWNLRFFTKQINPTVPLETMGPFATILPRSNRGFDLQFHLGKTLSNRIKNLGFT